MLIYTATNTLIISITLNYEIKGTQKHLDHWF